MKYYQSTKNYNYIYSIQNNFYSNVLDLSMFKDNLVSTTSEIKINIPKPRKGIRSRKEAGKNLTKLGKLNEF